YPKLNTSSWASGMYVVQIVTDNAVQTKRVVKQ
ncbi:MAG: T9SS type A sorting domain-containing protein, partial [Flavobacteriaceae bacterium]